MKIYKDGDPISFDQIQVGDVRKKAATVRLTVAKGNDWAMTSKVMSSTMALPPPGP